MIGWAFLVPFNFPVVRRATIRVLRYLRETIHVGNEQVGGWTWTL